MTHGSRPNRPTLAIIGAGPKALAIAAKARALEASHSVPNIVLIDEHSIAANWDGGHGYTDGRRPLGTPPEKDIGYPYASAWEDDGVSRYMLGLSWQAFLARPDAAPSMTFAEWVDRGRPQPTHGQWARYLGWVAQQVQPDLKIGRVTSIDVDGDHWRLTLNQMVEVVADGLVITGPGPSRPAYPEQPGHPLIYDGRSFWEQIGVIRARNPSSICIIGTGETAAAVTVALVESCPDADIHVVSTQGTVYSRGESFEENRLYTDPDGWQQRSVQHRKDFVRRTDRAVFSQEAKRVLDQARTVRTKAGRVTELTPHTLGVYVTVQYGDEPAQRETYDMVVVAVGFDPCWFFELMTPEARDRLPRSLGAEADVTAAQFEAEIDEDLAVRSAIPRLHLPMLSGLEQGPGFPNLSSLGRLSDRILAPYCHRLTP